MTYFSLAVVLILAGAYIVGATAAALRFSRRSPGSGGAALTGGPPVSVLKPLHGAEPGLYGNLRSFAEQDYPEFQLVFGVRDRTDSALPVARTLISDRPRCDIELVVDPRAGDSNLKVANLENMLPAARHGLMVLVDSDMRVGRDYLRVVTAPLADPATGVVTCLYKAVPGAGFWSQLAALHINFGFLPSALVGDALASTHNPEKLLPVIVHASMEATGAVAGLAVRDGEEVAREGIFEATGRPLRLELASAEVADEELVLVLFPPPAGFDDRTVALAHSLAAQAAVALDNARVHASLER